MKKKTNTTKMNCLYIQFIKPPPQSGSFTRCPSVCLFVGLFVCRECVVVLIGHCPDWLSSTIMVAAVSGRSAAPPVRSVARGAISIGYSGHTNLLWTPAQRKRASMLCFANAFLNLFIFYGRLILRPWLTEVRKSFTRGGP